LESRIAVVLARGALVFDLAALARTIALVFVVAALRFRSRRFEWVVAIVVIVVAVTRLSTQEIR
jgi:hypothetical protein